MKGDEIEVLEPLRDHLLSKQGPTHVIDPIPVPGRELEFLTFRRLPHPDLEIGQHLLCVTPQKRSETVDHLLIVLRSDGVDAWAGAFLDVIEQTRTSLGSLTVEQRIGAGADREGAKQLVEGLADGVGVGVRPEVLVALPLGSAHHPGPGPFVAPGDGQIGVRLVVDELDVETGTVPLDQRELEHQGCHLGLGDDPLHRLGVVDHRLGAGVEPDPEVRRHAASQALGLADVDHLPVLVTEEVGARLVRYLRWFWSFEHAFSG